MTRHEQNIASMIADKIKEKDASANIILYGSHARGDTHPESDWDILVLLNKPNVDLKTEQEFRHHIFDLELEIGESISIYVHSKEVWEEKYSVTPWYKNVSKEGIALA